MPMILKTGVKEKYNSWKLCRFVIICILHSKNSIHLTATLIIRYLKISMEYNLIATKDRDYV